MNFDLTAKVSVEELANLVADAIESKTKDYTVTLVDFQIDASGVTGCNVTLKHKDAK